jgi:hypothetical protein
VAWLAARATAPQIPSFLSTAWTTNGGSCAFYGPDGSGDGCQTGVNASLVELGPLLPHMPTGGMAHPLRIVSRLLVETPPPDALPGYYCMHVVTVSEGDSPTVVRYEFTGLPAGATQMVRLFDVGDDYRINITSTTSTSASSATGTRTAHDVLVGKSAVVHRIGCSAEMLPDPNHSPLELIHGGDFEGVAGSGPSLLRSDKHRYAIAQCY